MLTQEIKEIVKWTLVVFTTGFIGYFGKYLGKLIISKFHNQKSIKSKYEYKIEKKKLKLEKKKLKLKERLEKC